MDEMSMPVHAAPLASLVEASRRLNAQPVPTDGRETRPLEEDTPEACDGEVMTLDKIQGKMIEARQHG